MGILLNGYDLKKGFGLKRNFIYLEKQRQKTPTIFFDHNIKMTPTIFCDHT